VSERIDHPEGFAVVSQGDGESQIQVDIFLTQDGIGKKFTSFQTRNNVALVAEILRRKGPRFLRDEILREESSEYLERNFRREMLAYKSEADFVSCRILDFACGSGASTCVLARIFPSAEVVGVELQGALLEIAERRKTHYSYDNITFHQSPDPRQLPDALGSFDFILMSAVLEHLLPDERRVLLPMLWGILRPKGVLFINQTPARYFPIEIHTTKLAWINYLPNKVACWYANMRRRYHPPLDWTTLLRKGIRGSSVGEIRRMLDCGDQAVILVPTHGVSSRSELWLKSFVAGKPKKIKIIFALLIRAINRMPGLCLLPELSLGIQKREI